MRSKAAQRILDRTPKDVEIFVRLYGDLVVRINSLLKEKGLTQKDLAEKMGKRPSELSKWLSGDHNLTLRSIAKLTAELDEVLLHVPKKVEHKFEDGRKTSFSVRYNRPQKTELNYSGFKATKLNKEAYESVG